MKTLLLIFLLTGSGNEIYELGPFSSNAACEIAGMNLERMAGKAGATMQWKCIEP